MLLLRVAIPDRPGSLGAVASAMGTVGADISAVEIVERRPGVVVDDFMLTIPGGVMPDSLVSACTRLPDVRVLWLSHYPESWGLESDIEVLNRMTDEPNRGAEILTGAAPVVFHCHWALLVQRGTGEQLFASELAPELGGADIGRFGSLDHVHRAELSRNWKPDWGEATCAVAPVRHRRAIILGRQGGPAWLDSELARLRFLAAMAP